MRAQTPEDWATVTGRVLDSEGRPVAAAKISAFPLDVAISGPMPVAPLTDQEGKYRLVLPAYHGRTRLCAVKPEAGYPDTQGLLFVSGQESSPEVRLTDGARLENVDIKLGSPDGTLAGFVVDAETRMPITKARISLRRASPASMYSTTISPDGHFFFALPHAPIEITVTAPGYVPWSYNDIQSGTNALELASSDHRVITVELKHVH
ncbi:MAG: carboxypeptidase-like regulatory domain-containing protein [Terriglobales bacterium]